jgi:hypothetical protein
VMAQPQSEQGSTTPTQPTTPTSTPTPLPDEKI